MEKNCLIKRFPIGVQSFSTIREDGFVYVDKTDLVYELAKEHVYFLCRPRRFGKSLLISTLEAYFKGRKELFDGLRIMELEKEWKEYPVFRIDFAMGNYFDPNCLTDILRSSVARWEWEYGVAPEGEDLGLRFKNMLHQVRVKTGRKAVVLIDEYDKPLLDVIGEEFEDKHRNILKGFYGTFKAADDDLRFVLLTGVTKFSQISVFSGFNQPNDISMSPQYEAICGITEEELHRVFAEPIRKFAVENSMDEQGAKDYLKYQYDGYHFSRKMTDVYNPFSIINVFSSMCPQDYWYRSGTPTLLVKFISGHNINMEKLLKKTYSASKFIDYRADVSDPLSMLYQSGYLTIKGYNQATNSFLLDYPNAEVRNGFVDMVANDYYCKDAGLSSWIIDITQCLLDGDVESLMEAFTAFFGDIDYRAEQKLKAASYEEHFHYTFYLIMKMLFCYRPLVEQCNSRGRCDMVVEAPKYVHIFEFKLNGTAEEALAQIEAKGYAGPYLNDGREIVKLGVAFSQELQNIQEWVRR